MKRILILLPFVAIVIVNTNGHSECKLGNTTVQDFKKEKLVGLWYFISAHPSLSDSLINATHVLKLIGNTYYVETTVTPVNHTQLVTQGTWELLDKSPELKLDYPEIPYMSGLYQISATDYEQFMIVEGCPPLTRDQGLLHKIYSRELCPNKSFLQLVEATLEQLNLNIDMFVEDPVVKKICSK